ncbi:hypothetical protein GCM10010228_35550 [Streptomyces massasporeus]|nr:hypothetical protein GCM10010228_35550 [Streptomyces massasporeus]
MEGGGLQPESIGDIVTRVDNRYPAGRQRRSRFGGPTETAPASSVSGFGEVRVVK